MKAKYYIGVIELLLISASDLIAQSLEYAIVRNDRDATVIVNNYNNDYDY